MAKALVIGEFNNGSVTKVTLEITSKALELGLEPGVLLFGKGDPNEAAEAGATSLTHADTEDYNGQSLAELIAKTVESGGYDAVLFPHSWAGRDTAGRVGALLDSSVIADIVELKNEGGKLIARKPVYAGKAYVNLAHKKGKAIFTIRPNSFEVVEKKSTPSNQSATLDISSALAKRVEVKNTKGGKIGLTEANIIISGGRGIKGPEFFAELQQIADLLGAALGASRATVDAGWIDHSHQVGQTGKTVSPALYIAVGISGAIQHLAGMGSSKNIAAINKDPEAPIFKVATYGVVDDLFTVIPAFKEELKKLKG